MIYWELFWTFLKIGAFTFGGGYAMLPMIEEQVAAHGWMTAESLVNFVAVSESTPGPFAVNIATFVGMETAGIFGAALATLGVALPSFVIILMVAKCYDRFRKSTLVAGCMSGLKPAVVGLIAAAAVSVGKTVFLPLTGAVWVTGGIFLLCLLLVFRKVHPILVVVLSGALGIGAGLLGYL